MDVTNWLKWDTNPARKAEIERLAREEPEKLQKMMSPRIAFGTAGLRAEMAPGFACMNTLTVLQASQGLSTYVLHNVEDATNRGVVIGHDHRHHSIEFAQETARAFAHLGFTIHYLGLVHTPLVPFGVKKLHASCGIMITASHNPAKDNGYKMYWENACQIIPPHDAGIAEQIDRNLAPWDAPIPDLNPVDLLPEYAKDVLQPLSDPQALNDLHSLKFPMVYTAMHGVGLKPVQRSLELLGTTVVLVDEQCTPNPDFPTVSFPNPEEKGALKLACEAGDKHNACLVLANDPDADRFSAAVRTSHGWVHLTGDQIGTLFANFVLRKNTKNIKNVAVVNSTVSSKQMAKLAELYGAQYYETLTGFKWIGNKAIDLEKEGFKVSFAYEEAIGYMLGHEIKDKDGVSALHVFVQLVAQIVAQSPTPNLGDLVLNELDAISNRTGYFATHNAYYRTTYASQTQETFEYICTLPRSNIGELEVTAWRDLNEGYDSTTPDHIPLLPSSKSTEMITVDLKFKSGGTARFTARGSGTEPKLKVYIEARADIQDSAQKAADKVWDILAQQWFAKLAS